MELPLIFEIVVLGVPFLAGLVYLTEEARLYEKPLRRLANAKLIGLAILTTSVYYGLTTTGQVVLSPEGLVNSWPTIGLCWFGTWLGIEIMFPTSQQGL